MRRKRLCLSYMSQYQFKTQFKLKNIYLGHKLAEKEVHASAEYQLANPAWY